MEAVLDAGPVGGEHGAFGGALAHEAGFGIRDPDFGQVTGAGELGEGKGVDFIGFDFGARDGFGAERVADDDFVDEGFEDVGDGPGVGGGLDGGDGFGGGEVTFGEGFEGSAGGREAVAAEDFAVFGEEDGFDFFFVEIQSGECHNFDNSNQGFWQRFRRCGRLRGGRERTGQPHEKRHT